MVEGFSKVSAEGLEPSTNGLKGRCSAIELRARAKLDFITHTCSRQLAINIVCTQKVSEQFWRCRNQIFWDTDYTENTDKARLFSVFFREIRASPWRVAMSQIPPLAGAPWSHRGDIFRVRIMETLRVRISHANLCVHT